MLQIGAAMCLPYRTCRECMKTTDIRVLALIRHGQYEQPPGVPSAHLPYALTREGQASAQQAAAGILAFAGERGLEIDAVIDCSRMRRAWETAEALARALASQTGRGFSCSEFEALAERSVGAAANLTVAAIEAILHADPRFSAAPAGWQRDAAYRLPFQGAESLADAGARVAAHLRHWARAASEASLKLMVGHGGAFRHAASALGALEPAQVSELSMAHCAPIYFEYRLASSGSPQLVQVGGRWQPRSASGAEGCAPD
jgi:broad specificity phosphatase PhoE